MKKDELTESERKALENMMKLAIEQNPLSEEIQEIVNDHFWEML